MNLLTFKPSDTMKVLVVVILLLLTPSCGGDKGSEGPATGTKSDAASGKKGGSSEGQAKDGTRAGGAADGADADAIPVRVAAIVQAPLSSLYTTSATLRAEKQAPVIARTRGVIEAILFEEGDFVHASVPLVKLENEEQRINRDRARSTLWKARSEVKRLQRLHDQQLLSDQEYDTAVQTMADARHAADLAELIFKRTTIRAPFEGVLLKRHLDLGATVSDGTTLFDIADLEPLYADVTVPERHVSRLSPGQQVRLTTDATDQTVAARIERLAPAVDPTTGTVKVTVAVEAGHPLRPGAFVRVAIVTDTHLEALTIPRSALVAEGRRWRVYRLNPDGQSVQELEVQLGFEEEGRIELLPSADGGGSLQPGDELVVAGAPALSDGARVNVHRDAPALASGTGVEEVQKVSEGLPAAKTSSETAPVEKNDQSTGSGKG